MWSLRHPNSKYEVKNVPRFSDKDEKYSPPRWDFVFGRAFTAAACYFALDLLGSPTPPDNMEVLFSTTDVPFFSRLDEITAAELAWRVASTAIYWLVMYWVILCLVATPSAIVVGLNWSPVENWRPVFGSLLDAYTIRNFWG